MATIETNGNHFCLHLAGADDFKLELSMVFTAEDRILIKNLYSLKGYNCTRLLAEFPEKNWKKGGVKKLLRKIRETGGCDR